MRMRETLGWVCLSSGDLPDMWVKGLNCKSRKLLFFVQVWIHIIGVFGVLFCCFFVSTLHQCLSRPVGKGCGIGVSLRRQLTVRSWLQCASLCCLLGYFFLTSVYQSKASLSQVSLSVVCLFCWGFVSFFLLFCFWWVSFFKNFFKHC